MKRARLKERIRVHPAAAHVHGVGKRQIAEAQAAGAAVKDVADQYADDVYRSAFSESPAALPLAGKGGRPQDLLPTTSGATIGRDELFRDIPGGTSRINNGFDRFSGVKGQKAMVARGIKKDLVADLHAGGGAITPALGKTFDDKAAALAERLANSNEAYRSTPDVAGKPFFSPDLVSDVTQRGQQHAKTVANVKAAIGTSATWPGGPRPTAQGFR